MSKVIFKYSAFVLLAAAAGYAGGRVGSSQNDTTLINDAGLNFRDNIHTVNNSYGDGVDHPVNFVTASERSTPAVVYIKTTSNVPQRSFNDWFFGDAFGTGKDNLVINSGSGVIVSQDGYIVTNNHVVEKAVKLEVILTDKSSYEATLVGTDPSSDLALLKIEAKNLPAIAFTNSNQLKVGEWVLAVGNPFNLTSTVTAGIVSAKGRNLNMLNNIFPIESFIQTDAAINPGNSGGALVNIEGDLVGINTAILSRTGAYNGYGFAIPANIVQKVIRDLKEFGTVQKAFFGADVIDLNAKMKEKAKLSSLKGVYISSIASYGPANDAGMREGDVVIELNGSVINSKANFDEQLSYYRPGEKVTLVYFRDGKQQSISLKLTNIEGTLDMLKNESVSSAKMGADFEPVGKFEKDKLKITNGVRISNITQGYVRRLGLREGFIITHINKIEVTKAEQCIDLLENMRGQVSVEGIDQNGRKAFYSYYSY
jgi:Do/DeqQ family serine protease